MNIDVKRIEIPLDKIFVPMLKKDAFAGSESVSLSFAAVPRANIAPSFSVILSERAAFLRANFFSF